ncbi:hypothetical protein [Paenibacillus sp. AD87]|uniref:hypothetical protein n=1 Tax=Paenibacillus sp. AD87 TaxID=1528787 RepID=UPI0012F82D6E|nr:hypothetical protein [Paenibacillus sp. AD87]
MKLKGLSTRITGTGAVTGVRFFNLHIASVVPDRSGTGNDGCDYNVCCFISVQ